VNHGSANRCLRAPVPLGAIDKWGVRQRAKGHDTVYMLKMREIYRHLSNAADRGDEAANLIGDIVVKMT
jgi:hypothetical protein